MATQRFSAVAWGWMDLAREAEDFYDVTIVTAESKNRFPSRQRANCVLNLALTPGKLIFDTG